VQELMQRDGFAASLGVENFCDDIFSALDRARQILAESEIV